MAIFMYTNIWPISEKHACYFKAVFNTVFTNPDIYILYWGLHQTSDRKAAPPNYGHLGYTDTLRATCCNGHLYLCKIAKKIDFLKICQEEGFYQLVSKLYFWGCLDFYFFLQTAFCILTPREPNSALKLHFLRRLASQTVIRSWKSWPILLKYNVLVLISWLTEAMAIFIYTNIWPISQKQACYFKAAFNTVFTNPGIYTLLGFASNVRS